VRGAGRGCGPRLQVGAARAADGFETGGDVDARVELFGFEQALVRRVEVFAVNVELDERETLAGGLFRLSRALREVAHLLAQLERVGRLSERLLQARDGALRRVVLD